MCILVFVVFYVFVFVLVVDVVGVELRLKRIAHNLLSEQPTPRDINLMITRHVYQATKKKILACFLGVVYIFLVGQYQPRL